MPLLLLLTLLASPTQASDPPPTDEAPLTTATRLLDQVVAVIGSKPLLLSELELEARVALISQGGTKAAWAPLDSEVLAAALDHAIGKRLAQAEAERLQVFAPDEAEVRASLNAFASRLGSEQAFRRFLEIHQVSEAQLAALFRRDLRVARYLEGRVRISSRVSEDEVRTRYLENPEAYGSQPFAAVRDVIRAQITREKRESLTRQHLDELLARSDVRVLASFARKRAAAPPAPSSDGGVEERP
jgi:hypothetical protein